MKLNLQFDFEVLLDLNVILQVHPSTVSKMQQREGNDCEYAKRILKARQLLELPAKGRELFEKPLFGAFIEEDQSIEELSHQQAVAIVELRKLLVESNTPSCLCGGVDGKHDSRCKIMPMVEDSPAARELTKNA